MLLLIDNYDSFTWNLVQAFGVLDGSLEVRVVRNDAITATEAVALDPSCLVISPGPCTPKEAGVSAELMRRFQGKIPVLGVCLGHQTIGDMHGMSVCRNDIPVHGKTSPIHHDGTGIFADLPSPLEATRYHSLAVDPGSVPSTLRVTARTQDGVVMALRHARLPVEGVQFHPESILTAHGHAMLRNYLVTASSWWSRLHAPR